MAGQKMRKNKSQRRECLWLLCAAGSTSLGVEPGQRLARAFRFPRPRPQSGHENGDEGQQEHQHSACQREHDRHHGHDGIDRVDFFAGLVAMVGVGR